MGCTSDAVRSLPSPQEASQQAESMSPQELVELEIDEETRDRLRFDPAWQPMLRSVQRDIMILKWGNNQLDNPVWEEYGPKAFPLLSYYARSNDPTRQVYGVVGIRALGKPYTTLWLEQQLQQPDSRADFYLITSNVDTLIDPYGMGGDAPDWQAEFGLDDAEVRDRLVDIARANLPPKEASDAYYNSFQLGFLQSLFPDENWYADAWPEPPAVDPTPLESWGNFDAMPSPSERDIEAALRFYTDLNPEQQSYLLVKILGAVPAGSISPVGKALLTELAFSDDFGTVEDQMWAIAELDRHNDPEGSRALQAILNDDLTKLHPLSRWASYEADFVWQPEGMDRATHAYYLLLGMVEKYPDSRFARGAKEYGDLRGHSYFGGEPRSDALRAELEAKTPEQRLADWQTWLRNYPDHPGVDDATYFVARAQQDTNNLEAATRLWIELLTQPSGDRDAAYLAWGHVRSLLDVGLTIPQLESVADAHQGQAIEPLLRYALAVHYARDQRYEDALATSRELDMTRMDASVLDGYYRTFPWLGGSEYRETMQQEMQTLLTEQRQRWQTLRNLQQENTPESQYAIASNWADRGGWKNGYLPVWNEGRTYFLPTGDWDTYYCEVYWTCNEALRGAETVHKAYSAASQNAIALQLYQSVLMETELDSKLREKAIFMIASTAIWQWENHPLGETMRIHPLPSMTNRLSPQSGTIESYEEWDARYNQLEQDYVAYVDRAIATFKQDAPQSQYVDDLLFSRYAMSGDVAYLQQIVQQYPTGDRAAEAQFLLDNQGLRER
ncbi:hypothetical protein ACQ4M4_22505 [Leptolyngbya sp. AN02str]|uniref:hypothetical protein n=1 Tax=Leptolyngbya sp. AN02str TaxID=3423363 RepID=UPI003D31F9A8